jgi:hypothetical protein
MLNALNRVCFPRRQAGAAVNNSAVIRPATE